MESLNYQNLAPVYDRLQQGIDWTAWADFIQQIESRYSLRRGPGDGQDGRPLLLDLGCGTGSFCLEMAQRGYDPIGIDASSAMLDQAREKSLRMDSDQPACLFLQQDISRFELYGTVDLIVCLMDTVNHLLRFSQVSRLFRLCANYLNPGGLLIFDLASHRHLARTLGQEFFYQDLPDCTLLWQNSFQPRSGISRSELALFRRQNDGSYIRQDETIVEKYYAADQISRGLHEAGLELAARLGDLSLKQPGRADERHFYAARRPIKPEVK